MPGLRFAITPEQRRAFEADQWMQPHMEALADDWEQSALARVQAPTPSDSLTNPLGSAGSETGIPPTAPPVQDSAGPSPAVVEPEQPAPASSLPSPTAPPPTDFGPVPQTSTQRPLAAPPTVPSPQVAPTGGLVDYARQAAQRAGIDPDLFVRQIQQESGFDPTARSKAGAVGIAQIVPRYHPGVNPLDPTASLDYAALWMKQLTDQYGGDVRKALAHYNGGAAAVQALDGTPYDETKQYISSILNGAPLSGAASQGGLGSGGARRGMDAPVQDKQDVLNKVAPFLGNAYVWGGKGPDQGFDCSGLAGYLTTGQPESTVTLYGKSAAIGQDQAQAGDLVFWNMGSSDPHMQHVGVYLGDGRVVQSGGTQSKVNIGNINQAIGSAPEFRRIGGSGTSGGVPVQAAAPPGAPTPDQSPDAIPQPVKQTADETISNPFGEAFRQLGAVKDQVGGALQGAGEQFVRNVTGTNPDQAEINTRFANVPLPTSPLDVAGAGLGAPTGGEISTEQRNQAIAENNPLRDVPVAGGATTFLGQAVLDPTNLLLLGEPAVARGVGRTVGAAGRVASDVVESPAMRAALAARQRGEGINPFDPPPLNVPRLSQEEALATHEMLGQQWQELDHQAALLEAQSATAFNPGLKARLANEAARVRSEQEDIMARADYLMEHGVTPPETHAVLPMAEPVPTPEPASVATATRPSPPSAVSSSAILSSPNYRRLQVMRGTAEQQAQLRPAEEGFAGNINLEKITPDAVKAALQRTMESPSTGEFAGQRRGVITDTQAMENAATKALSMSPADWIKTRPGRAFNQEEALALGNQMVKTGNEYAEMRAALQAAEADRSATDTMRAAVADKSLEFALLEGVRSGAAAEAGRALRSFRQTLDGALATKNGDTSKALRAALKTLGGEDAYAEWAQKWGQLADDDTVGKYRMLQALHQPSRMQKLVAWTTSNMLSGTKTLEVNLVGGAIETLNRPVIELLGGRPVDAVTDIAAMGRAVGEAWGNASTTLKTGVRPSLAARVLADPTKYDAVRPEAFGGKSGLVFTPALRVMSATDEFMRTINAAGALAVAARREARATGKTVQSILSEPSDRVLKFAQDAADAAVFEGKGLPISEGIIKWRNLINETDAAKRAVGVAANVLFPFVHIPEQILIRGTRMLPVVNEASTIMAIRKGLQSGDQQAVRDATARYILTTGVLLAAGSQVLAGNITGMGPKSPEKRASLEAARDASGNKIWQAHSIKIGDRWVDYTNLGPVSIPLAVLSNAHEAYLESGRKPGANEVADVFDRVASTVLDATYIKSFGDLMRSTSEGGVVKGVGSLVGNTASRFVPYAGAFSQIERSMDQETKNPRNLPEYVASRVPGASELVPDKPSPFGGSIQQPQDVIANVSPFKTSAAGLPDPVAKAFVDAGMGAPAAPPTISIRSVLTGSNTPPMTLTQDEKVEYTRLLGQELAKRIGTQTASADWARRTPASKQAVLEATLKPAREAVENQLYRGWTPEDRQRRMAEGRASKVPQPIAR